jgi:hypothetical protein
MARFVIEMSNEDAAAAPKSGRFVIEQSAQQGKAPNPAEGGVPLRPFGIDTGLTLPEGASNFMAGVGKAITDIGRGAGQMIGVVSRKDVEDARKLDAALMDTTAGKVGNIAGNVATFLPTALIPGANTLTGAGIIGAASGLLQPSASTGETVGNTVLGGASGPIANMAGRAIGAGYQGAKALVEPFFEGGQNRIAARTLQNFAADPAKAAAAAKMAQTSITGAQPTLAEATKDSGLSQLQRALQSADPAGFSIDLAGRQSANNATRIAALKSVAGDDVAMQAALKAREEAAQTLYGKAFSSDAMRRDIAIQQAKDTASMLGGVAGPSRKDIMVGALEPSATLKDLSRRDSFRSAMESAKKLANDSGEEIGSPLSSLRGLHYIKLALDDALEPTATNAVAKNSKNALSSMKETLLSEIERIAPTYGTAKTVYQEMSAPINQMQVGQRLLNQYTSAAKDLAGNPRLRGEAFNRALRNEDQLLRQATGYKGSQSLESVMTPDQLSTIRAIADELSVTGAVETAARASGSPTAQNLASQNVLRQFLGPTGLPESWAESALLNTIMRPVQFAAKAGEPKITNRLAEALLNPKDAAALLEMASIPTASQQVGRKVLPWLAPVATGFANSKE